MVPTTARRLRPTSDRDRGNPDPGRVPDQRGPWSCFAQWSCQWKSKKSHRLAPVSSHYQDWREVLKRTTALRRLGKAISAISKSALTADMCCMLGPVDLMAWGVVQAGTWGRLSHRAAAVAFEGGYQPKVWKQLKPRIRGGYFFGSGDKNPNDNRHGTFFEVLPTPRPFARFPFFNLMNLEDRNASLVTGRQSKSR